MYEVQKQDLVNTYNYGDLVAKRKKELGKWRWIILIGCLLFQMLPYCVALNLANVFAGSDWAAWLNGDTTLLNLTFTIGALAAAFVAPSIARILGKPINMRAVYCFGVALAMIGFALLGIDAVIYDSGNHDTALLVALLWIPTMLTQIGVMVFSGIGVNNLISRWWQPEKRGFALGIAFAGGSLGNIWMQQLVGVLAKEFGNFTEGRVYDPNHIELQWATYLILGAMGLISGVLIALVICRKPIPPINMFDIAAKNTVKAEQVAKPAALEASPLVTKKYPPYWILAVGYLILQMGTVHASTNGQIIEATTAYANNLVYTDVMALGGTLFGVTCLIGNVGGGILNDKLGPTKSISLAGTVQVGAILCLLFSVKIPALVYVYFILAGLSVYIYTSTPAFICGRLFGAGQSNNQMAILSIFIAVGFAIVNSIAGVLMGNTHTTKSEMLGVEVHGHTMDLMIFAIVCMGVGTMIVAFASMLITKKGIAGMLDYSPTKFSRIIFFRHSWAISFSSFRISLTKKDFRNDAKRIEKIKHLDAKNPNFHGLSKFEDAVKETLNGEKLSPKQRKIISLIFFNKYMAYPEFNAEYKLGNIDNDLEKLVEANYISPIDLMGGKKAYILNESFAKRFNSIDSNLDQQYPKFQQENKEIASKLNSLNEKLTKKTNKLSKNLAKAQNIVISAEKQAKIEEIANNKIIKLKDRQSNKMSKLQNAEPWKKFNADYFLAEKILATEASKNKLQNKKDAKIKQIKTKMGAAVFVTNYDKFKEIEGHNLVMWYINDIWSAYDTLINERIVSNYQRKIGVYNNKINFANWKIKKITKKENAITSQFAA